MRWCEDLFLNVSLRCYWPVASQRATALRPSCWSHAWAQTSFSFWIILIARILWSSLESVWTL